MISILMRLYLPFVKLFFRAIRKKTPGCTMEPGCRREVASYCADKGWRKVLIVTDETIRGLGLLDRTMAGFDALGIGYAVFDRILPNPTASMCEAGRKAGLAFGAEAVAAFGGGAVLDTAKIIASGIAQPKTGVKTLCTILMPRKILPHIAIPTTAGTGAEVSMGAVISDDVSHRKRTGGSPIFTYDHVFLDAEVTVGLPPHATAAFGIDALSHAVESYLSIVDDKVGKACAVEAIRLIFEYLPRVCENGTDMEGREKMAYAAMRAGIALNSNNAGFAHPLAHALGGKYGLAHGDMIAATLVPTLRFESDRCGKKLAELCVASGLGAEGEGQTALAARFVDRIEELIRSLGLDMTVPRLREEDIPELVKAFFRDAALYPIPKCPGWRDAESILRGLIDSAGSRREGRA